MMGRMATPKTSGNPTETLSDYERIEKTLDHIDTGLHELCQKVEGIEAFIDLHRPALARGLALMDPGAKVRSMLPSRQAKV
jgi:hypothetical protein